MKKGSYFADFVPFRTSDAEQTEMLKGMGHAIFYPDHFVIADYPFTFSAAFDRKPVFTTFIENIDLSSGPITVKVKNELIFISAEQRNEVEVFATRNDLPLVKRPAIWDWILEPFLDTEYTDEMDERLGKLLSKYGLDEHSVSALREEVGVPMLKYNFDTMLWDWCSLGLCDVLGAMRIKYKGEEYDRFYQSAMEIALLQNKLSPDL